MSYSIRQKFFYLVLIFLPTVILASNANAAKKSPQLGNIQKQLASTMNRLNEIQNEFNLIKGQVEAANYLNKESDRVYRDLDMRVSAIEDKIDQIYNLLKQSPSPPTNGKTTANSVRGGELEEYDILLSMIQARDYRNAASGFMGYIKKYPKSPKAGSAQYWIAESHYFLGDYAKSIQQFQKLVEKHPRHPKIGAAIYKQGLSFEKLTKLEQARLFYQKVMASHPNTPEAAKAQTRLHRLNQGGPAPIGENPSDKPTNSVQEGSAPLF